MKTDLHFITYRRVVLSGKYVWTHYGGGVEGSQTTRPMQLTSLLAPGSGLHGAWYRVITCQIELRSIGTTRSWAKGGRSEMTRSLPFSKCRAHTPRPSTHLSSGTVDVEAKHAGLWGLSFRTSSTCAKRDVFTKIEGRLHTADGRADPSWEKQPPTGSGKKAFVNQPTPFPSACGVNGEHARTSRVALQY